MNHPQQNSFETYPRLKSDIVFLVDLITSHSAKVELVTADELQKEFLAKATTRPSISVKEAQEQLQEIPKKAARLSNTADDSPEGRERRRLLSRRQMLSSLFKGELSVGDLQEPDLPENSEELTPEYFNFVLQETLKGPNGIAFLDSWDNKRYYHFTPLLSSSFARLLSTKNNPYQQILDTLRESSRLYPRPVGVFLFEFAPFRLDPKLIQEILDRISKDPQASDIKVSVTSAGTVYLYSSKYLEDDYADFLAEEMDQGGTEML